LRLLLSNNPAEILDFEAGKRGKYRTTLYQACVVGNYEVAKHLIRLGASIDGRFGDYSSSLLQAASIGGNKRLVKYLLQRHNFRIEEPYHEGHSPLMLACREGNKEVATVLIHRRADPTQRSAKGETALDRCAISSSPNPIKITKVLLWNRSRVFDQQSLDRAFLIACDYGKDEIVNILLNRGADPNFRGPHWTGLQFAIAKGHEGIFERLLMDGRLGLLVTDFRKRTILHLACSLNRVSIIALLLLHMEKETQL
jgi:ankyrin